MKIELESILDKYIIVVDGDEKKVVYDVDDSSIFSVSITGSGRGARNAVLSKKTFKTFKEAEKGIKYLDTCHWHFKFKAIKVSELKDLSEKGWDILIKDIEGFNWHADFEKKMEAKRQEEERRKYLELKNTAIKLVKSEYIYSIEEDENNEIIIRCSGSISNNV
jgi:uncharacterized membrane protein